MLVLNEGIIRSFVRRHPDCRSWIESWLEIARATDWESIDHVRETYPSADGGVRVASGGSVTVFNVSGNKYRLVVSIVYKTRMLIVLDLLTHAEYSKNFWKRRL